MIIEVRPIIRHSVRELCRRPYYGHPKGCPNFGRKKGCPPTAPYFDNVYDPKHKVYAIYNTFDIAGHVERMKRKHPDWSIRQVECCLYWQNTARKKLSEYIKKFMRNHEWYTVTTCPEAMGVNITKTMARVGIELEWPPIRVAYQIALAGVRK